MEHVTVKELGNGKVELIPDKGYLLKDIRTGNIHSEVVIKRSLMRYFIVIED